MNAVFQNSIANFPLPKECELFIQCWVHFSFAALTRIFTQSSDFRILRAHMVKNVFYSNVIIKLVIKKEKLLRDAATICEIHGLGEAAIKHSVKHKKRLMEQLRNSYHFSIRKICCNSGNWQKSFSIQKKRSSWLWTP